MRNKSRYLLRSVSLVLVACVANVFVFGAAPVAKSSTGSAVLATGILSLVDMNSATVNGNIARNGATILSGSDITVEKSDARVDLGGLGSIELATGSSATLSFSAERVSVTLLKGQATLTAMKGIVGTITTPEGETLKTDPTLDSSTVGNSEKPATAAARKGLSSWTGGEIAGLVVGVAVTTAVITYFAVRETSSTR